MPYATLAQHVDQLLLENIPLWRDSTYQLSPPAWSAENSALAQALLALSDETTARLQGDDEALLLALIPAFPVASDILSLLRQLSAAEQLKHQEPPAGVPGRKWQQVLNFCQHQPPPSGPVLEWCCGKSYLGRELRRRFRVPILALDNDRELLQAAKQDIEDPQHQLQHCDVLSEEVKQHLGHQQRIVALHACGGLHQRLLQCAVAAHCPELTLSPCCYHRFNNDYQPLSRQLKASALTLTNNDLRTAVRQSQTARRGETLARRTLQARQFALRHYLSAQGLDGDTALPSLPTKWLNQSFADHCAEMLNRKNIDLPPPHPQDDWMHLGWNSLRRAERFELLRMAFRRLLELRCVLDSVLFLEEHNYHCQLSQFCPATLTPRNLMIFASRNPLSTQ